MLSGSSLAVYNALIQLGKQPEMIIPECPAIFEFLPSADKMQKEGTKSTYDLAIVVDCGDIKRLNGFANYFEQAKTTINIDHHSINSMFADYNFVNPDSPACCQVLIMVLEFLGVTITKEIGSCLVAGIITDTGGFKYASTSKETFEFTAKLLGLGVNVADIYRRVLEKQTKGHFELSKIAMERLELLENGKIAFTYITKEDEEKANAQIGDHSGLVDIGRSIEGVEVSILLSEKEEGVYKGSLRSNEYVNVADVGIMFNGGGHIRAAGFKIYASLEEAKERVIHEVSKHLK
jgi:phosphoesterase RecJ-like protein